MLTPISFKRDGGISSVKSFAPLSGSKKGSSFRMGRGFRSPLLAGLLLSLWVSAAMAAPDTPLLPANHEMPTRGHQLRTEFSDTVTLARLPEGAKTLELWLPAPSSDAWQRVESLKVEGVPAYRIT
jgi:hypothetical protein